MSRITNEERLMKLETQMTDVKDILVDLKSAIKCNGTKLDKVIEGKVDKTEFDEYKKSQSNWYRWIPTLVTMLLALVIFLRGI